MSYRKINYLTLITYWLFSSVRWNYIFSIYCSTLSKFDWIIQYIFNSKGCSITGTNRSCCIILFSYKVTNIFLTNYTKCHIKGMIILCANNLINVCIFKTVSYCREKWHSKTLHSPTSSPAWKLSTMMKFQS